MFRRFIAGLSSPRKVMEYRYDKWYYQFLVILLMLIISLIPITYYSLNSEILSYDVQKSIRTAFVSGEEVNYVINDNKLEYLGDGENITKIDSSYGRFIFSCGDVKIQELAASLNYIFLDDHLSVYYNTVKVVSFDYTELDNFNGIDFRLAKVDDYDFWSKVFTDVNKVFDSMSGMFVSANIIGNLILVLADVMLCIILVSLVIKFQSGEAYKNSFKMAVYISVPTLVGMVLSIMYDISIFNTIGMIISFVYAYRISFLLRFKGGI